MSMHTALPYAKCKTSIWIVLDVTFRHRHHHHIIITIIINSQQHRHHHHLRLVHIGLIPTRVVARWLTHWGRVTHICVSNLTIIGSDNGLSPDGRQVIIWTNSVILSIGILGTNFSEMLLEILTFSFNNMRLKVSSGKWRPFCLGPNVLSLPF